MNIYHKKFIPIQLIIILSLFSFGRGTNNEKYDPTTLVFPPYLHTLGIRKATQFHLFLFMQNRVKFRDPQGLAVARLDSWEDTTKTGDDDEVTIYGVNSGQNNIIYNKSMTLLGVYGLKEKGEQRLNRPRGITANSRGDVFIADTGNNRIVRLFNPGRKLQFVNSIGNYGSGEGEFNQPHDIALDSQNNVYITDTGNHRIQVFDENDHFQYSFGVLGKNEGELYYPNAITVNDRRQKWNYYSDEFIMVIDLNNSRIQKFSKQGKFLKSIEIRDFDYPNAHLTYLTFDYYSNVYVTDKVNHCIHKFDRNLGYLTTYGRRGKGKKEFIEPRGITIYRRFGQIFVSEKEGAQYYWIGTDFKDFSIRNHQQRENYYFIEYFLTEPAFVTMDVFTLRDEFVTRIWNKRFKSCGQQRDVWSGYTTSWPDSILQKDNLTIATQFRNIKKVPPGEYIIKYKFEPTYSSYHYFHKKAVEKIEVE